MRILCIAAAGGHLEQMLVCLDAFAGHQIVLAHYNYLSLRSFRDPRIRSSIDVYYGGDNWWRLLLGTLYGIVEWTRIFLRFRPQVIFSTGAEIAIVPFWLGRILFGARCVFLETAARQDSPSMTGRIVYPVCHRMFVQSKTLLRHYGPKARFAGTLL